MRSRDYYIVADGVTESETVGVVLEAKVANGPDLHFRPDAFSNWQFDRIFTPKVLALAQVATDR